VEWTAVGQVEDLIAQLDPLMHLTAAAVVLTAPGARPALSEKFLGTGGQTVRRRGGGTDFFEQVFGHARTVSPNMAHDPHQTIALIVIDSPADNLQYPVA
jgi:hypothetical protein